MKSAKNLQTICDQFDSARQNLDTMCFLLKHLELSENEITLNSADLSLHFNQVGEIFSDFVSEIFQANSDLDSLIRQEKQRE